MFSSCLFHRCVITKKSARGKCWGQMVTLHPECEQSLSGADHTQVVNFKRGKSQQLANRNKARRGLISFSIILQLSQRIEVLQKNIFFRLSLSLRGDSYRRQVALQSFLLELFYECGCLRLHVCLRPLCMPGAYNRQKSVLGVLELESSMVVSQTQGGCWGHNSSYWKGGKFPVRSIEPFL